MVLFKDGQVSLGLTLRVFLEALQLQADAGKWRIQLVGQGGQESDAVVALLLFHQGDGGAQLLLVPGLIFQLFPPQIPAAKQVEQGGDQEGVQHQGHI